MKSWLLRESGIIKSMVLTTGWRERSTFSRSVSKAELWLRYLNTETTNKMTDSVKRQIKCTGKTFMFSLQNLWPLKNEKLRFKSNVQGKTREVSFLAPCLLKAKLTTSEDGNVFSYGILRILHRLQQMICGFGMCAQDKSALQFVKFCRKKEQNFTTTQTINTTLELAFKIILSVWEGKAPKDYSEPHLGIFQIH